MAEASALPLRGNPDIEGLLELLSAPGHQSQRQEYISLVDYVDAITRQYDSILRELADLKEKVGGIADRKNPIALMMDNLEKLAADVGAKLKNMKDGIIAFTKNALDTVKEKGLSALGAAFSAFHVRGGLQAMSRGLAKSAESLDKAVERVASLERHNREKTAARESGEAAPPTAEQARPAVEQAPPSAEQAQAVTLADLLADTRVDFENLAPDELKAVYEKLLAIGMNNGLTANENVCLQSLVSEAGDLLPGRGEHEPAPELEADRGAEM
jgi:hypothetical protein